MGGEYEGDEFQNALFQNPGNENNWITLKLVGTNSSKDAIGARIKLIVSNETSTRAIYRVVSSGGSFGANSLQLEIGIAEYDKINSLTISWPNSSGTQKIVGLTPNKIYSITEGLEKALEVELAPIHYLKKTSVHQHHH
jgi:hypothetical protein